MTIYGVQYSTEGRARDTRLLRFPTKEAAIKWRDGVGPAFIGWSHSSEGERYCLRRVYELYGRLPTGSRLIGLMDRGRCSSNEARVNWVVDEGELVK